MLGRQGDYDKNVAENSQVGMRVSDSTPSGLTLTLNYPYRRLAHDDGVNTASMRGHNQCWSGTACCPTARDVTTAKAASWRIAFCRPRNIMGITYKMIIYPFRPAQRASH